VEVPLLLYEGLNFQTIRLAFFIRLCPNRNGRKMLTTIMFLEYVSKAGMVPLILEGLGTHGNEKIK
jgi:hypothetical protein